MEKLNMWPEVTGKVTPLFLANRNNCYLKGFRWHEAIRPKDPQDVLRMPQEMKEMLSEPEVAAPVRKVRNEEDEE